MRYEDIVEYRIILQRMARNIRQYERFPKDGVFRKLVDDMKPDFEFSSDRGLYVRKEMAYNTSVPMHIRTSLYFEKIDDDSCKEHVTGEIFVRTNDNRFYNENTGLRFDFYESFEPGLAYEKYIDDENYKELVAKYFDHFREIKEEDDRKRSIGYYQLLKRNNSIIKGEE